MKKGILNWLNAIAFIAMVAVNILSDQLPIGHGTNEEISGWYPTLFTPAGYTFSIWAVIYSVMLFFIIVQMEIRPNTKNRTLRTRIGGFFIASCVFNIAWIFFWHYERIGSAFLCMLGLLISLSVITDQINLMGRTDMNRRIVRHGFDLYYGWIMVATIANFGVWLYSMGWKEYGFIHQFLTILAIYIGAFIALYEIIANRRWLLGLTFIWSYIGIAVQHISSKGFDYKYPVIFISTIFAIGIIVLGICIKATKEIQKHSSKHHGILQN